MNVFWAKNKEESRLLVALLNTKNNLFKYLRENKIFMENNEPYATHIRYFKVVPVTKYNKFGSIVVPKTLIKPEGIKYIVSKLMRDGYVVLKSYSQILDELSE